MFQVVGLIASSSGAVVSIKSTVHKINFCNFCKNIKTQYSKCLNDLISQLPQIVEQDYLQKLKINNNFSSEERLETTIYKSSIPTDYFVFNESDKIEDFIKLDCNDVYLKTHRLTINKYPYFDAYSIFKKCDLLNLNKFNNFKNFLKNKIKQLDELLKDINCFINDNKTLLNSNNIKELENIQTNIFDMRETLDVLFYILSEVDSLYKSEKFNFKTKAIHQNHCKTLKEFVDCLKIVDDIQTLSIDKIINFRDNLNHDVSYLNSILDKIYKKYEIINNFADRINIINNLEEDNIEESCSQDINKKINSESELLTSKNCQSENLKKSYICYINNIIILSLLKVETQIASLKVAICKSTILETHLNKTISILNNYERNSIKLNNGSRVWLDYFNNNKLKTSHQKQVDDFKTLCKNINFKINTKLHVDILKHCNTINLIYITNNYNSINLSLERVDILNSVIELINCVFSKNCYDYLNYLFTIILAEKKNTDISIFKLIDLSANEKEFTDQQINVFNSFYSTELNRCKQLGCYTSLWKEHEIDLFEALFTSQNNTVVLEYLDYFVKSIYCRVNSINIYSLLPDYENNEKIEKQLKDKFHIFIEKELNYKFLAHMNNMRIFHQQYQEMEDEYRIRKSKLESSIPTIDGVSVRNSYFAYQAFNHNQSFNSRSSTYTQPQQPQNLLTESPSGKDNLGTLNLNKQNNIFKLQKNNIAKKALNIPSRVQLIKCSKDYIESEINDGNTALLVSYDVLSKQPTGLENKYCCKATTLNSDFFSSLKPYMIHNKPIGIMEAKQTNVKINILKTELPTLPQIPNDFKVSNGSLEERLINLQLPTPPGIPNDFKASNGSLEERLINLQFPSTPQTSIKIKNNLCSITLSDSNENIINMLDQQIKNFIYKNLDGIDDESLIINSLYSDYFSIINKYQYLLISFNNYYIFYLGSIITYFMYAIEFIMTLLIINTMGIFLQKIFNSINYYIPNNIKDTLSVYLNLLKVILSIYFNVLLLFILYTGFFSKDNWLITRTVFLLYYKNGKSINVILNKINHLLGKYKQSCLIYCINYDYQSNTSNFNIGF